MRRYSDILFAILLNVILVLLIIINNGSAGTIIDLPRIVIGFCYLVFVPGYVLQAALLSPSDHIFTLDRITISFGLSIALLPIMGLVLDGPPGGIFLWQSVAFLSLVTGLASVAAIYRRSRLKPEAFELVKTDSLNARDWWQSASTLNRVLLVMLFAIVLISTSVTVISLATPKSDQLFTEFYMISSDGLAENYPREVITGQPFTLQVGVINREGVDTVYSLESRMGAHILANTASFTLANGQSTSLDMTLSASTPGDQQMLEILLLRDNQIYRRLYLWLNVEKP